MKELRFKYKMKIDYSEPVEKCRFTIKCLPQNSSRQLISELSYGFEPEVSVSEGVDGFGNRQLYGFTENPHDSFVFYVEGRAQIDESACEEKADECTVPIYKHPFGLNKAGESIKTFFNGLNVDAYTNNRDKAIYLMDCLHNKYLYTPGHTDTSTTAEEAFKLGHGVCQDYAHIFIALCHLAGIPARYITGMVIGEGESHAWTEILDGDSWIAMDPTGNKLIGASYIKIGQGRDASDCLINRGIITGLGKQNQSVNVLVEE